MGIGNMFDFAKGEEEKMLGLAAGGAAAGAANYYINKWAATQKTDPTTKQPETNNGNPVYNLAFLKNSPYLTGILIAVLGFGIDRFSKKGPFKGELTDNIGLGLLVGGVTVAVEEAITAFTSANASKSAA